MNKFELELNENRAKAFFVRHGEKLGLVIGVGLLGLFVYLGLGLAPDMKNQTPSTLATMASNAENRINSGDWNELKPFREAVSGTVEELDSNKVAVDSENFPMDYLLARRSKAAPPRQDPAVLAPLMGEADFLFTSVADTSDKRHALKMLKDMLLEDSAAEAGKSGPDSGNDKSSTKAKGPAIDLSATSAAPGIDPEKAGLADMENASPRSTYLNVVKFVVPFKQMHSGFRETFKNSMGYDPSNDRLLIRYLEIERRVNSGEWEDITQKLREEEKLFVVSAPNPFDEKYADSILTRAFPPILLQDYFSLARHSMIPLIKLPEPEVMVASADSKSGGGGNMGRSGRSGRSGPPAGATGRSGPPAGATGRSGPPAGMGGMSGRSGQGGMATMTLEEDTKDIPEYKLVRFTDQDLRPGSSYQYRVRIWVFDPNNPVPMKGFMAKSKRSGPATESATASQADNAAQDFQSELMDENFIIQSTVKMDSLSAEVRERLALDSKLDRPLDMLKNCRPSAWSDPSPEVKVAAVKGEAYVGEAEPAREGRLVNGAAEIRFPVREGSLAAVAAIWDSKFDTRIPIKVEAVFTGSVIGGQSVARILDPITRAYKKLENNEGLPVSRGIAPGYKGSSGVVLVDFLGGQKIDGSTGSKSDFKIPTEALLLDSIGNLIVSSSDQDARNYTWLTGEVLREDGVAKRDNEQDDMGDGKGQGNGGQGGGGRGRSGYPGGGGGGNQGGAGQGNGGAGRSGGGAGRSGRPGG